MQILLFTFASYLIGSVSFSIITSKIFRLEDPRTYGSNNPGATNVLRSGSKIAATLTLLGDSCKGWLAVWLTQKYAPQFGGGDSTVALSACAVFLGHLWPIFFHFSGGKGVATFLGILTGISIWIGLATIITWIAVAYIFRYSSLAALITSISAPFFYTLLEGTDIILLMLIVLSSLLIYRHSKNISNLLADRESRINTKKRGNNTP